MNNYTEKLTEWASECNEAIDSYLELTSRFLLGKPQVEPKLQWILKYLAISCNSTSLSAFVLIGQFQLWDAEILLRSVIEGTIKYVFLCFGKSQELEEKADEFLDTLPEIDELTQHKRVEAFLAGVNNPNGHEWDILKESILEQSRVDYLKAKYPRKVSQQLKQKWSFNEMAKELSNSHINTPEFEALRRLLAYSYGISSHLIHQDGTALKLIWDQNQQDQQGYEKTQLAFASRQLNDLLIMANFRSFMTFKLHNVDPKPVLDLFETHKELFAEMSMARENWWSEQKV